MTSSCSMKRNRSSSRTRPRSKPSSKGIWNKECTRGATARHRRMRPDASGEHRDSALAGRAVSQWETGVSSRDGRTTSASCRTSSSNRRSWTDFTGSSPAGKSLRSRPTQQAQGYGLKADYFAEVCHALRSASDLAQSIRARLRLSGGKRDCTAIERLACGLAKLLLIDPDDPRFEELVVHPAEEMRRHVRSQLHELDPNGYQPELQCTRLGSSLLPNQVLGRLAHYELLEEIGHGGFRECTRELTPEREPSSLSRWQPPTQSPTDERAIRREMDIYESLKQIPNPHSSLSGISSARRVDTRL